jgi:hypothetical protein
MKKIERLYVSVVGINFILLALALYLYLNYRDVQSFNVLFLLVSLLVSIGFAVYFYYPSPQKIGLCYACVAFFNAMFWSFFKASTGSSKTSTLLGFVALVIILVIIGILIVQKHTSVSVPMRAPQSNPFAFSNQSYQFNTVNPVSQQYFQNQFVNTNIFSTILYHGTPKRENARDILNYGFLIGQGNSHGTGLYLGDLSTAKNYAMGTGSIIKVQMVAPPHQIVDYNDVVYSPGFWRWFLSNFSLSYGDNITNYTLTVLKKRFLKVNENFYVAVAHRTVGYERVVFEGLNILGVLDAYGNPV